MHKNAALTEQMILMGQDKRRKSHALCNCLTPAQDTHPLEHNGGPLFLIER